jgi:hypothetical protein
MPLRGSWFAVLLLGMFGPIVVAQSAAPASNERQEQSTQATEQAVTPVPNSQADTPATDPQSSVARTNTEQQKDGSPAEKKNFRWRLGTVSVGAGYSHFSGPYYPCSYPYWYAPVGYYPADWVAASVWYPLWSPYPRYGPGSFSYNSGRGEVRLTTEPKAAEVYIDGGYAGTADKLKNLWLDPGAYDLTVTAAGLEDFHQRVYVLSGKTLKITAKLSASKEKP